MKADEKLVIWVIIALIVGIYYAFFSKPARIKRKLRVAEGKKIKDFKDGDIAKAVGEIKYLGKTLTAPLSGRRCVYYYVLVEQLRDSGKSSTWWDLIEEEVAADVVIKDGNQYAVIQTGLVNSHLVEDRNYSSGFMEDATQILEKYLERHGHKSENFLGFNKTLRYKEGILEEGELLAVLGKGSWKMTSASGGKLKIPATKFLSIGPNDEIPVYLSDHPSTTYDLYEKTNTEPPST